MTLLNKIIYNSIFYPTIFILIHSNEIIQYRFVLFEFYRIQLVSRFSITPCRYRSIRIIQRFYVHAIDSSKNKAGRYPPVNRIEWKTKRGGVCIAITIRERRQWQRVRRIALINENKNYGWVGGPVKASFFSQTVAFDVCTCLVYGVVDARV